MKKLLSLLIISIFISSIASAGLFKSAEEKAMEAEIEEELFGDAKTGLAITRLRRAYTGCTENSDGSLTVRFQRPWKDEETKILEPKCVNGVAYKRFCEEKNGVQTFNPRFAKEDCECDDKGKRCLRDENDVSDDTFASPPDVDTEEYESFSCSSLGEEWFCATPQLARQECGNKGYRLSTFTKCLDKGFCAICGDEKYKGIKFTCANGQKYTERGRCLSKDDLQEIALDFCEDKCISSDCRENSIDNDGDRVVGRDACTRKRIDCNDFDPNIHPGAVEVCDGFDNNCNGKVDEGPFSDRCNDCECKYGNLLCTEKACAETCTRGDTKDCGQGVQTCIQCSATMDCIGETTWSECSDEVCGPQAIPDCKQGFNIVEIKKANGCFDYTCQEIEKPSPEECNTIIPDCAPLVPIPFEMDNGCLDYSCAFPEGDLCNAGETHDCFTGENGNVLGIKECVKNPISDRYEFQEECAALYGCQAPWPLCDKETEEVITDIGEDGCQIYSCGPKQEEKEKCKEYDHICKEDWIPTPHIGWSGCMDGFGCSPPDQHDCLPGETRECGTGGQQKCELEPNSNDYIWRDCLAPNCQANWPDCDGVITTTYVDDCPKYSCEPTPPSLVIPCTAEDREFYKIPDVEDEVCASLNTDIYDCGQHKYCEMTMRNGPFACRHDWVLGYEKGPCENTCLNNQLDTGESLVDQGGPCPRSPELERQCSDQVLNGNEDDTDCGGDCPACDVVPTCNDGVQNGRETGEDCGGPCPVPPLECGEGEVREFTLYNEKNCPEYTCVNLKETDHCNNGYWDNIEIGVDCGGACPECQVICNNGERDADEISVDCGGTNCEPCPKPNHCYNKYQNSDETDVDCGGSCGPCPPFPTDPTNKTNETNESPKKPPTVPPSCNDGIKNGNEIGKDCGGSCGPCLDGPGGNLITGNVVADTCNQGDTKSCKLTGTYADEYAQQKCTDAGTWGECECAKGDIACGGEYTIVEFKPDDKCPYDTCEILCDEGTSPRDCKVFGDPGTQYCIPCKETESCYGESKWGQCQCDFVAVSCDSSYIGTDHKPRSGCPYQTCDKEAYCNIDQKDVACTDEYAPACARNKVNCVTEPCDDYHFETYSSACKACSAGALSWSIGECEGDYPDYVKPTCEDGIQNQDETCIDGGGICHANIVTDCFWGYKVVTITGEDGCPKDTCVPIEGTCDNGVKDNKETGVDCGGPDCETCPNVPTCDDGKMNGDEECIDAGGSCPNVCGRYFCVNGIQDEGETGVDCGGPYCDPCSSCADGILNQGEKGIDCEGPCPQLCHNCVNAVQDGDETDVDCGGSACAPCPSCTDGYQNGKETDIDCGGPDCKACDEEKICGLVSYRLLRSCEDKVTEPIFYKATIECGLPSLPKGHIYTNKGRWGVNPLEGATKNQFNALGDTLCDAVYPGQGVVVHITFGK